MSPVLLLLREPGCIKNKTSSKWSLTVFIYCPSSIETAVFACKVLISVLSGDQTSCLINICRPHVGLFNISDECRLQIGSVYYSRSSSARVFCSQVMTSSPTGRSAWRRVFMVEITEASVSGTKAVERSTNNLLRCLLMSGSCSWRSPLVTHFCLWEQIVSAHSKRTEAQSKVDWII